MRFCCIEELCDRLLNLGDTPGKFLGNLPATRPVLSIKWDESVLCVLISQKHRELQLAPGLHQGVGFSLPS